MTFKYIFILGDEYVSGFDDIYPFCHIPLDTIVIDKLTNNGSPDLDSTFARIRNYDDYFDIQKWVREHSILIPLDLEFKIWLHPDDDLKLYLK